MPETIGGDPDASNGYEEFANEFIAARNPDIGADVVRDWARKLPIGASILDLGCGTGVPISQSLIEGGSGVYGVDASPTMAAEFHRRFPQMSIACEPVETSAFFNRSFDGVVAIGLMFLLPADVQRSLIFKVASTLYPGGHFLFTSPVQACEWDDLITGLGSRSLGEEEYAALLSEAGLVVVGNHQDQGGSHYYDARRPR